MEFDENISPSQDARFNLKLANNIKAYWADRGKQVDILLDQQRTRKGSVSVVRSDMVGGWPVGPW